MDKKKYWFKPKRYGWGFVPVTWQGWVATMGLVALLALMAIVNNLFDATVSTRDGFNFLIDVLILSSLFTLMFRKRVEGGLRWQWGKKKEK